VKIYKITCLPQIHRRKGSQNNQTLFYSVL
jgi:hypothetical protein